MKDMQFAPHERCGPSPARRSLLRDSLIETRIGTGRRGCTSDQESRISEIERIIRRAVRERDESGGTGARGGGSWFAVTIEWSLFPIHGLRWTRSGLRSGGFGRSTGIRRDWSGPRVTLRLVASTGRAGDRAVRLLCSSQRAQRDPRSRFACGLLRHLPQPALHRRDSHDIPTIAAKAMQESGRSAIESS